MPTPIRVLLIEDSPADAELALIALRQGGYAPVYERVDTAETVKAALEEQRWDIILSDYVMPGFSATAALRLVQSMGLDVPFIVVTGQVGEDKAVETMKAGANDYVLKGNLTRLVPAMQRELQDAEVRRQRKLADEALRQAYDELELRVQQRTADLTAAQQRLAITLRSIGDGVIAADRQGDVTMMNVAAEHLTGWQENEAIGHPLPAIFHVIDEETRQDLDSPVERAPLTGENVDRAHRTVLIAKDGTERIIANSTAPIRAADGTTAGVVLVFRDVTARKRINEALRESEAKYRQLFLNIAEEVHFWQLVRDEQGRIVTWRLVDANPPALKTWARTLDEIRGKTTDEIFGPGSTDHYMWVVQKIMAEGMPHSYEDYFPHLHKYFRFTSIPLRDHFITTGADITDIKKANEELRQSEERLRHVLDDMIDGVFVCDADGQITMANESGMRMLGFATLEEAARSLPDFPSLLHLRHLDGSAIATEELPLYRALAGEVVVQHEEIASNIQTRRDTYLRISAAPIRGEKGDIMGGVAVVRDITGMSELDRLKDEFIEVAAHELKTPVTIMKGNAQALLRAASAVPPPNRRMLESIDRGADRIDRIVKDLLDISKIVLGRLELRTESVDLTELVEGVVNRFALTTARHRLTLTQTEPVIVQGDRERLEQAVANLIDNAIKYSPQGGSIDVALSVAAREVVVSVKDEGVGIPAARQYHIFERFYRAHTGTPYDYGGMGVGLFICHEIIAQHNGRMWFESEEGKGSTFYLALPLA